MRLTVLGNPDRYLAPLAGGTGYLVEHAEDAILLDCGSGVRAAPALAERRRRVRGIVLSHFHHDHALDLVPVLAAMPEARLVLPPEGLASLDHLARAFRFRGGFGHAAVEEAADGWTAELAGFRLRSAATAHGPPALAWRVEAGGSSLVYAGDTAPSDAVVALARGADALLAHTLLPRVEPASDHARRHTTAETAGTIARAAGVRRLLLSHRFHEEPGPAFLEAARSRFDGDVRLLRPGESVDL